MNREFYAIKGWVPDNPMTQLQIVEKQLESIMNVVQSIPYKPVLAVDSYRDWAISPNGVVPTHDFCTTAQFSTYLRYNLPKEQGELFDPNSDDSRRWLVFTRRAGMYSSSTIDSHDNTVSYAARIMGTMIRNSIPQMMDDSLYDVRREIGYQYFNELGIRCHVIGSKVVVNGVKIGGRVHLSYVVGGEELYASISGHLISEILFSTHTQSLDFGRMFRVLSTGKPVRKYLNHIVKIDGKKVELGNILSEHQAYEGSTIWHNYHEYRIAIRVACILANTLGIPVLRKDIDYISDLVETHKDILDIESDISRKIRGKRAGGKVNINVR
jgi:hypothetical protein